MESVSMAVDSLHKGPVMLKGFHVMKFPWSDASKMPPYSEGAKKPIMESIWPLR